MFAVFAIALLCLVSVSRAAPLDCKDLTEPLGQVDPRDMKGRWSLVADSMKIIEAAEPHQHTDSIALEFFNTTYTQANRYGDHCHYSSREVSIKGPNFHVDVGHMANFTGTIFNTSCPDCMMLSFNVESPNFKSMELCLFSRRREVDQKELEEFRAQVECLNMPKHVVMDPTKELCPIRSPRS